MVHCPFNQLAQLRSNIDQSASRYQGVIQPEGDSSPTTSDISREPSPAPPKDKKSADAALSDDSYFNSNLKGSGDEERRKANSDSNRNKVGQSARGSHLPEFLNLSDAQNAPHRWYPARTCASCSGKNDDAKKIFTKNTLSDMCGLSGITTEVLYKGWSEPMPPLTSALPHPPSIRE
ncbi:hypothetical protein EVAR_60034_1 [Eumeta japonica]|uniref:Uncharacterized protein n=1 Tax=Eumeta variegata TaxID=151549 RepID=A0A4C1ZMA8_EUMVA|nr:hypothetical protein EVAR_60034_1 [Eumeta japonica]